MTTAAQTLSVETQAIASTAQAVEAPQGWAELRDDNDIQFEPIDVPPPEARVPSAFEEALRAIFEFLGELLAPVGRLLALAWPVLQWVLLALLVAFILYLIASTFGPLADKKRGRTEADNGEAWRPSRTQSMALLEDADQLAAEGRFDEATHLLLQRSVGHIATARPDLVEPSSTARELSVLPALSDAARAAFATISERVERSLFALRSLDRDDWETARSAYAEFALTKLGDKPVGEVAA